MNYITDWKVWGERIASHAQKGAAMGVACGKMCSSCAFKFQEEDINGYSAAVDGAVGVLLMGGVFNCHRADENGDWVDAGKPCAGMQYAKLYTDNLQDEEL